MGVSKGACFLVVFVTGCAICASSEEDSGSIEIPDRPENRRSAIPNSKQEDKNLLWLLSKVLSSFQGSLVNRSTKTSNFRYLIQKTKKALKGVKKAYAHVVKAQKWF
ncbi:hypothetical protein FQR65_LT11053 [Abscondita terminalis]|nr:hypothetical protein FQR65_LT11053 [Abscondita terminalis]